MCEICRDDKINIDGKNIVNESDTHQTAASLCRINDYYQYQS